MELVTEQKIGAKKLQIFIHIRLTLITLPWKINQLLFSRALLFTDY
jgi:hypothetical protein